MVGLVSASSFAVGVVCGFILRSRWYLIKKIVFRNNSVRKAAPIENTKEKIAEPENVSDFDHPIYHNNFFV
jgi:hypothetical protein